MRLKIAMRTALSVALTSLLAACGGGGGGGDDDRYPADNTIQVVSGTLVAPAGNYRVDTQSSSAGVLPTPAGLVESATAVTSDFLLEVDFKQSDPKKYVLIFGDRDDDFYACRSQDLSNIEMAIWFDVSEFELPVCGPGLTIDARNHRAKASNVVIPGLDDLEAQVTVSANLRWALQ